MADAAIPMIEYFPLPIWDELPDSEVQAIFVGEPEPANGRVSIDPLPGLGVKVNEAIFD